MLTIDSYESIVRRVPPPSKRFLTSYLPYVLRLADQTLSAPFYAILNEYGVGRSEWRVLAVLHEFGELGVVELAAAALSPQPTITHAVKRLEKRDLITRTQGTHDKRQRFISITSTGSQLTAKLIDEARTLEADALGEAGDLSALVAQLHELIAIAEAQVQAKNDQAQNNRASPPTPPPTLDRITQ